MTDPIKQAQNMFCNTCGFYGPTTKDGTHLRPKDGQHCNYSAALTAQPPASSGDRGEDYPNRDRPMIIDGHACQDRMNGHDICIRPKGHDGPHDHWDEENVDILALEPDMDKAMRAAVAASTEHRYYPEPKGEDGEGLVGMLRYLRSQPNSKRSNDDIDDAIECAEEVIEAQEREIARLREALADHNERLRTAVAIADREGKDTNWLAFRGQCRFTLAEHHDTVNEARDALKEQTHDRP